MIDWRFLLGGNSLPQFPQNPHNSLSRGNSVDCANSVERSAGSLGGGNPIPPLPDLDMLPAESALHAGPLPEISPTEADALPQPPLPAHCFVTWRDDGGRLCGGWEERAENTVQACTWNGTAWTVVLQCGVEIPLKAVVAVGKLNEEGRLIGAWTVRGAGYDGEGGLCHE